jgi:hypothetical protein
MNGDPDLNSRINVQARESETLHNHNKKVAYLSTTDEQSTNLLTVAIA